MIEILNRLVDEIERRLSADDGDALDVDEWAAAMGTTGYHLRRMFSSLAGMPMSVYVRRRRMTVAATDVVGSEDLLTIAVRYGYGSVEAFGRAFRAVHGVSHGVVRGDGGPLRSQPQLRFRLTVEGNTPMDSHIIELPAFRLIGHAARVPLIHEGANPHIQRHIAALPASEHVRLKRLSSAEPAGLLQVSADVDPDHTDGERTDLPAWGGRRHGRRDARGSGRDRRRRWGLGGLPDVRPTPGGAARRLRGVRVAVVTLQPVAAAPRPLDRLDARPRARLQHGDVRTLVPHRAGLTGGRAPLNAVDLPFTA